MLTPLHMHNGLRMLQAAEQVAEMGGSWLASAIVCLGVQDNAVISGDG